ncbi:chromosome segregation protein SMC [Candidatus Pacearchaeota archaeon]|nr:chromosome segregation protein SMC [Candidatus Pacearchaeota archaeon]
MAYIKKLVIHGFKSFANRTEIPFDKGINVIIGANGSGKSNISDALCFVLGRLSIKSMRAAKAANLLFQGTHEKKPAHEAYVELIFDNSDKTFKINSNELIIKRIVRSNGLGIYKINHETKTRQEVLELLSQAGIDPNGFNIVLQGEIAHFVKMRSEDRREIIEEIAGISVYEMRKQKALHEIEKTEEKLKEVSAVLRERTSYLKNLEEERKQALRFRELEKTIKQCKASLIKRSIDEKEKEKDGFNKDIEKNKKYRENIKSVIDKINKEVLEIENKINEINQHIQKATGFERESLNDEITELNSKIAADKARKENFEKKIAENEVRKQELESNIKELESDLNALKKQSPKISKRQDDLKTKKQELEKIEDEKERLYSAQTEFNAVRDRIRDKEKLINKIQTESKLIFNQIKEISESLSVHTVEKCNEDIAKIKENIEIMEKEISELENRKTALGKSISVAEAELERNEKLKSHMPKTDLCPLCQTKLTKDHTSHVINYADERIKKAQDELKTSEKSLSEINIKLMELNKKEKELQLNISKKQFELVKLNNIEEKRDSMKRLMDDEKIIKSELTSLENEKNRIEKRIQDKDIIEERYQRLFFEMQELSSRTDENLDTTILYKERELENVKNVIKNIGKDKKEIYDEINRLSGELNEAEKALEEKEKTARIMSEKFKKMFEERTELQEKIKQKNSLLINQQTGLNRFDDVINNLKVNIARVSAEEESFEFELREFQGVEFLQGSKQFLEEKLKKSEQSLVIIGSVNLRALETYDAIKEEYEKIAEKAQQLEKERDEILKIIQEIDIKKKKTFMKTFNSINELFTRNFSQLSTKGHAFLEIENEEDIFAGGVSITIKVAKGKYFDVSSLSGGEQTLIALSLIFAIQEFKPYFFYILDEIDAALDKRNSELLSNLLQKYIKAGQYIIISHNDSIISGADIIYGISMNHGISKVLSLKISEGNKVVEEKVVN